MEYYETDNIATTPTLYYDVVSSHARSCQILIQILKINVDLKSTDKISDLNLCETYRWINSFFKLPTLVDGGITLCNGHSILIYLCQKYDPKNVSNLCPSDYITRQKISSILFYEGCILHRCLSHLMTDIILAKYPQFNVECHKTEVSNVYNSLNTFLRSHMFMITNFLTIADISVLSSVSALSIIFPIDHDKYPKLFDWFEGLKKMEFYNCNDEGILKLRHILRNVGNFPFPSPFAMVSRRNSNRASEQNNKTEEQMKKTMNLESSRQTYESEITEKTENLPGHVADNANVKAIQELKAFNLNDTYFTNESKCNCCFHAESKNDAVKVDILLSFAENKDFTETTELYKKPETVENSDSSTASNSEDNINGGYAKPHQRAERNCSKICNCNCNQNKKGVSYKHNDTNLREVDEKTSNDITVSVETNEEVKTDSNQNSEENCLTKEQIEDMLANVQRLKKILEIYNKQLKGINQISTIVSDNCSNDSIIKKFPHICGNPASSNFQEKSHLCNCYNKPKISDQFCRVGSRVKALDFDEITSVVMPEFLIRNLEKQECPDTSPDTKDDLQKSDRLEAGSNDEFKNTNEQLDNNILHEIIISPQKFMNSKIPRLISHSPACVSGQESNNSKLTSREMHCDCLNE